MTTQQLTEEIAKAVNQARVTREKSNNELAELVFPTISRTQLQRKLNGTKSFTTEELALLAEVLDWPLADFLVIPSHLKQVPA